MRLEKSEMPPLVETSSFLGGFGYLLARVSRVAFLLCPFFPVPGSSHHFFFLFFFFLAPEAVAAPLDPSASSPPSSPSSCMHSRREGRGGEGRGGERRQGRERESEKQKLMERPTFLLCLCMCRGQQSSSTHTTFLVNVCRGQHSSSTPQHSSGVCAFKILLVPAWCAKG